ncbi:MAG: hypothetical protein RBR35_17765 [Salinivirgaceae bacterium]|nr:hypothetical protein [Salinivirgaceae bacterium]
MSDQKETTEVTWDGKKVTAKGGLLFIGGLVVDLPLADAIADKYGFSCAERLVKAMGGYPK